MGPARPGGSWAEPDRPNRRGAPIGLAKLGSTRGIARAARNLGRARGSAGRAGAHLGLARRAGAGRCARACAHVGIASAPGRRPSSVHAGAELGCTGACGFARRPATPSSGSSPRVGRVGRSRAVMGRAAAGSACCASARGASARGTGAAPATCRPASRGAVMERLTSGSSRASVGSAG
jgi:hypothetical protein